MKSYPSYSDSNVDWIGDIPSDWRTVRAKYIFEIKKNIAGQKGYDVLSVTQQGIKIKDIITGKGQLSMDYSKYQIVDIGDFVMNHMDLLTGYVDISKFLGVTSPDYRCFVRTDDECVDSYYLYLFQMGYKNKIFYGFGQGSSMFGRWRLPTRQFNNFKLPYPTHDEQRQIASFLDSKTQKIDKLISLTEQKIELLKEQRTALINQCVTKGLNPDVEMKDSGVEWIGRIPHSWKKAKLYQYGTLLSGATPSRNEPDYWKNGTIPWMSSGEINKKYIKEVEGKITEKGHKNSNTPMLPIHTVMIGLNGQGKTKGTAGILEIETTCNQSLCGIIFNNKVNPYYQYYFLDSQYSHLRGLVGEGKREGISVSFLKRYVTLVPPLSDQEHIVQFLNSKTAKIHATIEKESKRMELLKEYRQALISEVVTGKIDVRDFNAV